MSLSIKIAEASLEEVVAISKEITEFQDPHGLEEYQKRLDGVPHLVLIAYVNNEAAGFKVGYERTGYFYSWMGAILPQFRRLGLAKKLAEAQETWAKNQGYPHVTFKTRNRLKPMLLFAIGRGFNIIDVQPREEIEEYRIVLRKKLV